MGEAHPTPAEARERERATTTEALRDGAAFITRAEHYNTTPEDHSPGGEVDQWAQNAALSAQFREIALGVVYLRPEAIGTFGSADVERAKEILSRLDELDKVPPPPPKYVVTCPHCEGGYVAPEGGVVNCQCSAQIVAEPERSFVRPYAARQLDSGRVGGRRRIDQQRQDPVPPPVAEDWERTRQEIFDKARAQGMDLPTAQIVAEGAIRSEQATAENRPVHYEDVERELEDLYDNVGAAPSGIENAKAKVMAAVREAAAETGSSLELHLFYCYPRSLQEHGSVSRAMGR